MTAINRSVTHMIGGIAVSATVKTTSAGTVLEIDGMLDSRSNLVLRGDSKEIVAFLDECDELITKANQS